jgi:predicted RNA-binding protein with PIN domain
MPEPTLYLFDGHNLMHAAGLESREELVDRLAGFVGLRGARGVVVFDGVGEDRRVGPLEVRFAPHADDLIERIAAERRVVERVAVVSSDTAIRATAGPMVERRSSRAFMRELLHEKPPPPSPAGRFQVEGALDEETRAKLERLRRRRS